MQIRKKIMKEKTKNERKKCEKKQNYYEQKKKQCTNE